VPTPWDILIVADFTSPGLTPTLSPAIISSPAPGEVAMIIGGHNKNYFIGLDSVTLKIDRKK